MSDPLSRPQPEWDHVQTVGPEVSSTYVDPDYPYPMPAGLAGQPQAPVERRWPEWAYMPTQPDRWAVLVAIAIVMAGVILGFIAAGG